MTKHYSSDLVIASYGMTHCSLCWIVSLPVLSHCFRAALIDYGGTGCTNDDISFVLGSPVTGRRLYQTLSHLSMSPPAK